MATKKSEAGLANVEHVGENALGIGADLLDVYKEFGGGSGNLELIDKPFFQVSIKASRFKIGENIIGTNGVIEGHLMRVTDIRAFYETKYDSSKPAPPDCSSCGGIFPDPSSEKKQAEMCAHCPQNHWGTGLGPDGKPSRGKACRQSKRLVLHMDGIDLPVILSLPPTSAKSLDLFLKMVSTVIPGGIPAFATVCAFSFDPKSDFPKIEMVLKDVVRDPAKIRELAELRNSAHYIAAERAFATAEEFTEAAASVEDFAKSDY